jgi:hypothetical protein
MLSSVHFQPSYRSGINPPHDSTHNKQPPYLYRKIPHKKADITRCEKFRWSIKIILERKQFCKRLHSFRINIQREKQPSKDEIELIDEQTNKSGIFQDKREQRDD